MSVLTKSNILDTLKNMQPTFKKEGVNLLGLFGSYSRDEAKEDSDIDILIETTPLFLQNNIGFKAHLKLDELKEILQNTFNKDVDFADKQGLLDHNNTYILKKAIYV